VTFTMMREQEPALRLPCRGDGVPFPAWSRPSRTLAQGTLRAIPDSAPPYVAITNLLRLLTRRMLTGTFVR